MHPLSTPSITPNNTHIHTPSQPNDSLSTSPPPPQLEIYLGSVSSSLSVWLTVAFTVERFIAVQYPLQRPTVCTVHRAKKVILTLAGFSVTVHLYVFVTAGVIVHLDDVSTALGRHRGGLPSPT